jgi:hypothetical protein
MFPQEKTRHSQSIQTQINDRNITFQFQGSFEIQSTKFYIFENTVQEQLGIVGYN